MLPTPRPRPRPASPLLILLASLALGLLLLLAFLTGGGESNAAAPTQQATPPPSATGTPSPSPTLPAPTPILLTDPVPDPHQPGVQYFPSTGHTLRGSFLLFWQQNGGLAQFGYPLTEEFVEPAPPDSKVMTLTVQYFQRNRFEHHPENEGTPYEVLLGTLGRDFHPQDPPSTPLPTLPNAEYFRETGHNLSGTFKSYWETHGGVAVHGFPISEEVREKSSTDGKAYTVQYFERSRMELHPEGAGTPYEVLLGLLGVQLAGQRGYFSGSYPPYGHAADFSWVSGHMELFAPSCSGPPFCGCSIFRYQENDERFQLTGVGWRAFYRAHSDNNHQPVTANNLVVFGHIVGVTGGCAVDSGVQTYDVTQAQLNAR